MSENSFTAAAVQASPVFLDREKTVRKAVELVGEAAGAGARLVVFPEAFVPTYPFWPKDLGFGPERKLVMDARVELHENSVDVPGKDTERMGRAAKKAGAYVVIGVNEREGGTLYNTILYFGSDGSLLGRHRKLMSIDSEKCVWANGTAEDVRVFETGLGRIGGLFCYEHHMTLEKYAMFAKGEQIHAGLWGGHGFAKDTMDFSSRQYAFEGQTFVVVSALFIDEKSGPRLLRAQGPHCVGLPGGKRHNKPAGRIPRRAGLRKGGDSLRRNRSRADNEGQGGNRLRGSLLETRHIPLRDNGLTAARPSAGSCRERRRQTSSCRSPTFRESGAVPRPSAPTITPSSRRKMSTTAPEPGAQSSPLSRFLPV